MKKIIPFKKDIKFDNIYEVTSISLEHTLNNKDNTIKGDFIVSGEYRITESSINTIPFQETLPFTIDIDEKYDTKNMTIDINDFYYEIIDSKYLRVNIEVKLDKIEEILIPEELYNNNPDIRCIEEEVEEVKEQVEEKEESIFNNYKVKDNYVNYRVYIVREGDNLDSIMTTYQVTKEELECYNDLKDIKIGDKIIIPYVKTE